MRGFPREKGVRNGGMVVTNDKKYFAKLDVIRVIRICVSYGLPQRFRISQEGGAGPKHT
jgi:hypothetical protein